MILIITLEFSPEQEAELRRTIKQKDAEQVRKLLAEAVMPKVEYILSVEETTSIATNEWEEIADQLILEMVSYQKPDTLPLSDYAVSRASIYQEHP